MSGLNLTTVLTCRGWRWQVSLNGRELGTGLCPTRGDALASLKVWVKKYV